jgi:hypothetical protein
MGDSEPAGGTAEAGSESTPVPWSQASRFSPASANNNNNNNNNTRQVQHGKLREYETRRRSAYTSKYDYMSLYWKSYCDLLSASLQETSRAKRLVLGTCRAHQLYADAMEAMHKDIFLDEKGNVANEKQQKRLFSIRKKSVRKLPSKSESAAKSASVLKEIRDAQHTMAERFGENAKNMDAEIAEAIGSLLDDLKQKFSIMEQLGNSILSELEKTEQEVTQAWGK